MGPVFVGIIGGAVAGFLGLLMWVAQRGKPTVSFDPDQIAGTLVFRHSWLFRGFALFAGIGIPLAITVLVVFNPPKNPGDVYAILGLYGLFILLSAPLLWESWRFAVYVSPKGIECRSPWRPGRFLPWRDIEEVSFSPMNSWFVIRSTDGWKFRIHTLVPGLSQFLEQCEQHLPAGALDGAEAGYMRVGRRFPDDDEDEPPARRRRPGRKNPFA
jgi:hypothetical protein